MTITNMMTTDEAIRALLKSLNIPSKRCDRLTIELADEVGFATGKITFELHVDKSDPIPAWRQA